MLTASQPATGGAVDGRPGLTEGPAMSHPIRLFGPNHDRQAVITAIQRVTTTDPPPLTRRVGFGVTGNYDIAPEMKQPRKEAFETLRFVMDYQENRLTEIGAELKRMKDRAEGGADINMERQAFAAIYESEPSLASEIIHLDLWGWDWGDGRPISHRPEQADDPLEGIHVLVDPFCTEPMPPEGVLWDRGVQDRPAHPVKREAVRVRESPEYGVEKALRERILLDREQRVAEKGWSFLAEEMEQEEHAVMIQAAIAQVDDPDALLSRFEGGYCPTEAESKLMLAVWRRDLVRARWEVYNQD